MAIVSFGWLVRIMHGTQNVWLGDRGQEVQITSFPSRRSVSSQSCACVVRAASMKPGYQSKVARQDRALTGGRQKIDVGIPGSTHSLQHCILVSSLILTYMLTLAASQTKANEMIIPTAVGFLHCTCIVFRFSPFCFFFIRTPWPNIITCIMFLLLVYLAVYVR